MADLVELKNQRKGVKSNLTRFRTYFDSIKDTDCDEKIISQLTLRLEKIEPCWDTYNEIQSKIENLEAEDVDEIDREVFENNYFTYVGDAKAFIKQYENDLLIKNASENDSERSRNSTRSVASNNSNSSNVNSFVKLPPIKLPVFDGKYSSWLEFKDSFTALVDENDQLTDIQKFLYLKSSLEKEVVQIIKSIEVSAKNYRVAWKFLNDRYENKKLMVYNHIRAIFEYPSLVKESFIELRDLYDNVIKNIRALESLGEKTESWDRLIIYIMSNKFDNTTRRDWESHQYKTELPTMLDLGEFLKLKCEILEKIEISKSEKHKFSNQVQYKKQSVSNSYAATDNKLACYYCKQNHMIYKCQTFLNLSIEERVAAIKKLKLCLNCLKGNHLSWNCKAQKCNKCKKSHNTLLHIEYDNRSNDINTKNTDGIAMNTSTETNPVAIENNSSASLITRNVITEQSQVLLSTAIVEIKNKDNNYVKCRALLDSGSQSHLISVNACKKLGLQATPINHLIKGVGESLTNITNKVKVSVKSCQSEFETEIDCLILPKITERLPRSSFNKFNLNIPKNLHLADPAFNVAADIDILLGSAVFWSVLRTGQEKLGQNLPIMQDTELGWIIAGNLLLKTKPNHTSLSYLNVNCSDNVINENIIRFWQIEEIDNKKVFLSNEESYCETYFGNTTKRNREGRFVVKMPFKPLISELGDSHEMALRRFNSLERKFEKNHELKSEYQLFMSEYDKLKHMKEIEYEIDNLAQGYFMPHHAVIKTSSSTTKCRVVFDASAKTSTNISLNDAQYIGPKLQQDLVCILMRFRKHKIVMTADISKMYRQILISDDQTKFQRILWRNEPNEKLRCYELQTVTYGTSSAPYLAVRCLVQLAKENEKTFPKISKIIQNEFYMDDVLTGAESVEEALEIQKQLLHILDSAGFQLRKWLSNNQTVLGRFENNNNLEMSVLRVGPSEQSKTLGVCWNANQDIFQYSITNECDGQISKRGILSVICQIFDPLGLLGPVVIVAKLIIQDLWKSKVGWDEAVTEGVSLKWTEFVGNLPLINNIKVPRHVLISDYVTIELHGFSDASECAFGACIYIRCISTAGIITSNLMCAKSRVAPLKKISIPRLELCAAVLLARLAVKTIDSLDINWDRKYFWTDSLITLTWIKGESANWKTFVANRVSEIQTLTSSSDWNHVRSGENPADLLSRGTTPTILECSKLWWHGPEFLNKNNSVWDTQDLLSESEVPEVRITALSVQVENVTNYLLNKFSSITKISRILAYVLRFINNSKLKKQERMYGVLTPDELNIAINTLIQIAQKECFSKEYDSLAKGLCLKNNSKILSLNPFLHENLIRAGGRINRSGQCFDKVYPIILPKGHILTELIVKEEHKRLLHAGTQNLLASVREKYWPISGRNLCKKIIKNCVTCFKVNPVTPEYLMGDLPDMRVKKYLPFHNVGTDFCGPFLQKDRKGRGAKSQKIYICLFICMSTKAVHLETVSELTTEAFLATLHRFISRRDKPLNIYSDNALNYVGAKNELAKVYSFLSSQSVEIARQLATDRIAWHFIPARSPSFGGIWEAGIKSTKFHIKRVIGNQILTYEEFATVICRIEAVLNSRPLCPLTNDPNDATALTPAHFLIGKTLTCLPEQDLTSVRENRLSRWQLLQSIIQHYWARWHKEYLAELQTRTKWKQRASEVVKIGSLVLIKEDNCAPLDWQLGRITKLYPGEDGVIRVVDVKVRGNVRKRAINRICVLPIET